jgi:NitT/TauT family transport system substrate-binding protein
MSKPDESAEMLQKNAYEDIPLLVFREQFKASKYYSNAEWRTHFQDGTATKWLQQVTDFFVENAKITNPLKADQYFDPKLYLDTVKA